MSGRSEILTAIGTVLASVSGLSADLVHRGIPDVTVCQAGPLAFVDCPNVASKEDDQLGSFRRILMVHIVLVTPAAAGVSARDVAMDSLIDNVLAALEADRTLAAVTSVPVVAMALESADVSLGDEISAALATQVVAEMVLRVEYITTSGLGI
jgi:hypothetical protein